LWPALIQAQQAVRLQPEEVGQFRELFQQAASNADKLHGQVAVAFLKRTGLPVLNSHVNLQFWQIAQPSLYIAMSHQT